MVTHRFAPISFADSFILILFSRLNIYSTDANI
jgi:hypothetical protein